MGRQNGATSNISDIAAAPLMKTNNHAALRRNIPDAQTSAMAVPPGRPLNWWQHGFRTNPSNMPETVLKNALFGRHLCRVIHMLHSTTAANAKMWTTWRNTGIGCLDHADQVRQLEFRLFPETGVFHRFARQRAVDKNGLAFLTSDAPRFVVQRLDNPDRHGQLRKSANSINRLH